MMDETLLSGGFGSWCGERSDGRLEEILYEAELLLGDIKSYPAPSYLDTTALQ